MTAPQVRAYRDQAIEELLIAFDTGTADGRCYGFSERRLACAEHHAIHCYFAEWRVGNGEVAELEWNHKL